MSRICIMTAFVAVSFMSFFSCSSDKATGPKATVPTVTTAIVTIAMQATAECGGEVSSDGGSEVTSRGVCWSINQPPTTTDNKTVDGSGTGSFTSSLSGLTSGTPYFVRAYATNIAGTGYGNIQSFTTAPTLTDNDGNTYQTVLIGTQVWMAENLKVTHYRTGEVIPRVTDGATWEALTTPACCEYDNSEDLADIYGLLYNWFAVIDAKNLAPAGWHVPTDSEWQILIDFLGGEAVAGGKMKEAGMLHWVSPNAGATNESGFGALPSGARGRYFGDLGRVTLFWSSTPFMDDAGFCRYLTCDDPNAYSAAGFETSGFSIRCVMD